MLKTVTEFYRSIYIRDNLQEDGKLDVIATGHGKVLQFRQVFVNER